jgi:RHH-type rel operon transcriptional repressor/antitoxin RelB
MLAIRLPEAIEKRLDQLAKSTGRTKTYYAREAILAHLEDLEDIYLAEAGIWDQAKERATRNDRRGVCIPLSHNLASGPSTNGCGGG